MATFSRTFNGLVFEDSFSRPISSNIGNGWLERESFPGDQGINGSAQAEHANVPRSSEFYRDTPQVPDAGGVSDQGTGCGSRFNPAADLIIQLNMGMLHPDTGGGPAAWYRFSGPPANVLDEGYFINYDGFTNLWGIWEKKGNIGNPTLQASFPEAIGAGGWLTERMVVVHDTEGPTATQRTIQCWGITSIPTGGDLSGDLVLKTQWVDTDLTWVVAGTGCPLENHDKYAAFFGWWPNLFDMLICCGRYVTVKGIPIGWTVEIDSRGEIVSTGADIIIDYRQRALPWTTITVRDGLGGTIIFQDTPAPPSPQMPAGGWGGDIWEILGDIQPPAPDNVSCQCDPSEFKITVEWNDVAVGETGYRVYRAEDDIAGPYINISGDLPADTEIYEDTTVEQNTRYYYYVVAFTGTEESDPSDIVTCRGKFWSDCEVATAEIDWTDCDDRGPCLREFLVLEQTFSFRDTFDRSDRGLDGDNGWTEDVEPGFSNEWFIVSNEATCGDNDDNVLYQELLGSGAVDANINVDVIEKLGTELQGAAVMMRYARSGFVFPPFLNEEMYLAQANPEIPELVIWSRKFGQIGFTKEAVITPAPFGYPFNIRGDLIDDGVDVTIELVLNGPGVPDVTWTDLAPGVIRDTDKYGMRINNPARMDDFIATFSYFRILDVPDGYSASVDDITYTTEIDNIITLLAPSFPQGAIYLKNDVGQVVHVANGSWFEGYTFRYNRG